MYSFLFSNAMQRIWDKYLDLKCIHEITEKSLKSFNTVVTITNTAYKKIGTGNKTLLEVYICDESEDLITLKLWGTQADFWFRQNKLKKSVVLLIFNGFVGCANGNNFFRMDNESSLFVLMDELGNVKEEVTSFPTLHHRMICIREWCKTTKSLMMMQAMSGSDSPSLGTRSRNKRKISHKQSMANGSSTIARASDSQIASTATSSEGKQSLCKLPDGDISYVNDTSIEVLEMPWDKMWRLFFSGTQKCPKGVTFVKTTCSLKSIRTAAGSEVDIGATCIENEDELLVNWLDVLRSLYYITYRGLDGGFSTISERKPQHVCKDAIYHDMCIIVGAPSTVAMLVDTPASAPMGVSTLGTQGNCVHVSPNLTPYHSRESLVKSGPVISTVVDQFSISQLCGRSCYSQAFPLDLEVEPTSSTPKLTCGLRSSDCEAILPGKGTLLAVANNTALCSYFANIPAALLSYSISQHCRADAVTGIEPGDDAHESGALKYATLVFELLKSLHRRIATREHVDVLLQVHIDDGANGCNRNTYDDIFSDSNANPTPALSGTGVLDVKLIKILS